MAIRELKPKERLTPALRSLAAGDTLRVPFRRYTRGFTAKAASETGRICNKVFSVKAEGQLMYMLVTRKS